MKDDFSQVLVDFTLEQNFQTFTGLLHYILKEYQIEEDELKYLGERVKLLLDLAIRSNEERVQQVLKEPNKYMKK